MSNLSLPIVIALLASGAWAVAAAAPPSPPAAIDDDACERLVDLPTAPMSVESCRTLLRLGEDDPGGHRPGDEAMSCAQIFAELRTLQGEGVSDASIAQTDQAIGEGRALGARHAAEIARQMTPSPLAIASSLLPNAVGAALMAPEQARKVAATMRLKAADAHYSRQLAGHMATNTAEVGQLLDANPRLPRLTQLAMHKDCGPLQE